MFSKEVPSLNADKFFVVHTPFYPVMTVLLEDLALRFTVVWWLPCNSIGVNVISFKPQKGQAMMVNLYAYQIFSYFHK